jgi:glucose/arabinose dehydrogenase
MRRRLATPLMLLAVGVVAACAGDDDDGTETSAAATSAPATSTDATPATAAPLTTPPAAGTDAAGTDARATTAPAPTGTAASAPATTGPLGDPVVALVEVASLEQPVDLAWRDGDDGAYLVEQPGRVARLGPDGDVRTVADVTDLTESRSEQGLLGLAFSPDGTLGYLHYTDNAGDTVVAAMAVDDAGDFDRDSLGVVYTTEQPYPNHNGGDLAFGPDGMLYIGLGDGGSGGDPERRATDLGSPLGKLLRIDPDPSADPPYEVPADNPFVAEDGAVPEIWTSGLRNPWRFSFDPQTGDLWIADVGQNAFEEIDVAPATDGRDAGRGVSFGWSAFEGRTRYNDDVDEAGHRGPLYVYGRDAGCSVSGGARYRGEALPALTGWYVFADYCAGDVWALPVEGEGADISTRPLAVVTLGNVSSPTAVVTGPDGELHVLSHDGPVYAIEPA